MDHPAFGVGPDLSGEYTREYGQIGGLRALEGPRETHCLFLEVAAETGFPGLGLFLGMLSTSIVTLFQVRKRAHGRDHEMEQSSAGFLLALTGYLTMGIFLHMSYIRYFWLMLGLADACHHTAKCIDGTAARPMAQEVHA